MKRARFRHNISKNLRSLYGKIRFNSFVNKKLAPIIKGAFLTIKKISAISKMCEIIHQPVKTIYKNGLKQIKLILGIKILNKILKDKETINTFKKHFWKNIKR